MATGPDVVVGPHGALGDRARIPWLSFTDLRFVVLYLVLILAGVAGLGLPGTIGRWLLPCLATFPAMVVLFDRYEAEDLPDALREMLWAALWMTGGMLLSFGLLFPIVATPTGPSGIAPVLRGDAYVTEMFIWLQSGQGPEGDLQQFLPIHLQHLGIVSGASLASAGVVGFLFGAVQMAYMNAYVYTVAAYAPSPATAFLTMLLAWHVWSVVRVVAFITLATALGYPLYARFHRPARHIPWRQIGQFCLAGLLLEGLDIVLKAILAEPVRQLLLRATSLSAG